MFSHVKEGYFQEEEDSLRVAGIPERAGPLWPVCMGRGLGLSHVWRHLGVRDYAGDPAAVVKCVSFLSFSEPPRLFRDVCELWYVRVCYIWRPYKLTIVSQKVAYCFFSGPVRISEEFFQTTDLLGSVYF